MSSLSIYAGPTALARLREEGLNADQFKVMLGASGGPKWFVLYGLDRYLFGEFFANRQTELITLGSSAGAWRLCCLATAEPVAAIERLAQLYSTEKYSDRPTTAEITAKARSMLGETLGPQGMQQVVSNQIFRTHLIADRCKGIGSSKYNWLQGLALATSAAVNTISRRGLSLFFQRTLFSNMGHASPWADLNDIDTATAELTESNAYDVMIASGSIPFVLDGVRDIDGARPGKYWDGGITDYHFDMPFHVGSELVLYPHFSSAVIPGWFDKHHPWRRIHPENFHNVVLLAPSPEFVSSLPHQKIPDRTDFEKFDYAERVCCWQEVLEKSSLLAEEFTELVATGKGIERVQAFADRPQ